MSRLTRDGTAELVSRDQILRHARVQGNISFPVQLTTSRIGNLTRLIHTLLYVMTIHTYIHTYIHTCHNCRESGDLLCKSYLHGHLLKRSTFRDQLVIPSACIPIGAYHDHAMSGGHLAYKHTIDKVRGRYLWPTLHHDVKTWCHGLPNMSTA